MSKIKKKKLAKLVNETRTQLLVAMDILGVVRACADEQLGMQRYVCTEVAPEIFGRLADDQLSKISMSLEKIEKTL